jgi:hypothetical protein
MTSQRCIFCFEADDPEDIRPLYAGPANLQPVAWVHTHCLADYADDETRREFDDIDAGLETIEPKLE